MKRTHKQTLSRLLTATLFIGPAMTILDLSGCSGAQNASAQTDPRAQSLPTVSMDIGNRKFTIEVAMTDEQQQTGLMYRDSMPADHGMIFVFPDEEERSFWMKNTRIPLDIAYLDKNGKVVSIKSMKPFDLTGIDSDGPAKYAIELNVNVAKQIGLKAGDIVKIPEFSSASKRPDGTGNVSTGPATRP
jgi:uncharacterized membrane protein (UPF0127 family)